MKLFAAAAVTFGTAILAEITNFPSIQPHGQYLEDRIFVGVQGELRKRAGSAGPPGPNDEPTPLIIRNLCPGTIWPGILTSGGVGPGTGGFQLDSGKTVNLNVGGSWVGRVWGRTNCSADGLCSTGSCTGMSCAGAGNPPATLVEILLRGGSNGHQSFYDVSLVDGYNLPMAVKFIPGSNMTEVPSNLTNVACIATPGYLGPPASSGVEISSAAHPVPFEESETNDSVRRWCPWDLLAFPPSKPGDGVYPYPDDHIYRPDFSPCYSACARTGHADACCTGSHNSPRTCTGSSVYSSHAKAVCPDAYSYAYDDLMSTFTVPTGGGFEVLFCPPGRSTNIMATLGSQMTDQSRPSRR